MDPELKQYLDAKFGELDNRFEGRLDAKFDVFENRFNEQENRLDGRLDAKFDELENRFEGRLDTKFDEAERRLGERIERVETSLLTAFHGWARPMEVRVNNVTTIVMGFEERLALAEQRISELERKRAS